MGGRYEAVIKKAADVLPAHFEFARKSIANKLGLRERDLRLLPHEIERAADQAARSVLRGEVGALIAENPEFLYMEIEGINHSTIHDELVGVIAGSIVHRLRPNIDSYLSGNYRDLDLDRLLETCRSALSEVRNIGLAEDDRVRKFATAVDNLASHHDRCALLDFGAEVDWIIEALHSHRRPELSRRLTEESCFALFREERFIAAPSMAPTR